MGYKRTMPQETKDKISKAMKGRKITQEHKEKIGRGVKAAWARVPLSDENNN